jgi:hypothetical protein
MAYILRVVGIIARGKAKRSHFLTRSTLTQILYDNDPRYCGRKNADAGKCRGDRPPFTARGRWNVPRHARTEVSGLAVGGRWPLWSLWTSRSADPGHCAATVVAAEGDINPRTIKIENRSNPAFELEIAEGVMAGYGRHARRRRDRLLIHKVPENRIAQRRSRLSRTRL